MSVWDSIKDTVGSIAPIAGTILGGPAGGAVGGMIASALGVANTPDAVAAAIKADPDAAIKIRQIEAQLEQTKLAVRGEVVKAEATGESWLQRNWRPLTMIWFSVLVGGYWFGFTPENLSEESVLSLFNLVKIGIGGYIGSRGVEKVTKTLTGSGVLSNILRSR